MKIVSINISSRRWTLRRLFALTAGAGIIAAFGAALLRPAEDEFASIEAIVAMGGEVEYSWVGPEWLRALGGERLKWFNRVTAVEMGLSSLFARDIYLGLPALADADAEEFGRAVCGFPFLRRLDLLGTEVSEVALDQIDIIDTTHTIRVVGRGAMRDITCHAGAMDRWWHAIRATVAQNFRVRHSHLACGDRRIPIARIRE